MKYRSTHFILIAAIIMLSALTVPAQSDNAEREELAETVVTLSPGQTLRLSVTHPMTAPASGKDGRKFKMLVAPLIIDSNGRVIASSAEIMLAPGEFHSFDFGHADLLFAAGGTTGNLQLRAQIRRRFLGGFSRGGMVAYAAANGVVELIDNLTGQTQATAPLRRVGLLHVGDSFTNAPALLGLVNGQSLRVNVASSETGPRAQHLHFRILLNNSYGDVIAQSPELVVPPGEIRSFEFDRGAMLLLGEAGTGRVQMAVNAFLYFKDAEIEPFSATLELVDNSSGRTSALLVPAVQMVRCAASCK